MAGYIGPVNAGITSQAQSKKVFTPTTTTTVFSFAHDTLSLQVFHNGVRLVKDTDYTANGTAVTLTSAAENGDQVVLISNPSFQVADTYTQAEADGRFAFKSGDTMTAVTGTTPSLDVGSYNFFDNGTLTGDTTVSFTNVPTNARWSYSCKTIADSGTWNVTAARYKTTFQVTVQEQTPQSIFFKPDGTKFYIVGSSSNAVNEYDLSTPWDVSTASYLQNFSVSGQETSPEGIFFKPDGTKMYILGQSGDDVNEYNLSTAWDVSTASYLQNFSVSGQETSPEGMFFKPDGTKMYVIGSSGDDVNEYNLSTAWDISTASYLQNFSVSGQETTPTDVFFKTDGTIMFVLGDSGNDIIAYDLSTAWDISTATHNPANAYALAFYETFPLGFFFHPDGTKLFMVGSARDEVRQFELGSAIIPTFPAAVVSKPSSVNIGERVTYEFFTMDGGTTVTLIGEDVI